MAILGVTSIDKISEGQLLDEIGEGFAGWDFFEEGGGV